MKINMKALEAEVASSESDSTTVVVPQEKVVGSEVAKVTAEYAKKMAEASHNEATVLALEMQEKINELTKSRSGAQIEAFSYAKTQLEGQAREHVKTGQKGRWVNVRPEMRDERRYQGYEPVKDGKGNEVRAGDAVLMTMPMRRFEETIKRPAEANKKARREAVESSFHATGDKLGVKTFGRIQYNGG